MNSGLSSLAKTIFELSGKYPFTLIFSGLGGIFYYYYAELYNWLGLVFGVILILTGFGSIIDHCTPWIKGLWRQNQENKQLKKELQDLSEDEKIILKQMVRHNKRIMRQNDFEKDIPKGKKAPNELYNVFTILDDKNIIRYSVNDFSGYYSVTANQRTWKVIKEVYKLDFNTAHKN